MQVEMDPSRVDNLLVKDVLKRQLAIDPNQPFIRFGSEIANYREVHDRAQVVASKLATIEVERAELVALMMSNSIEYVNLYFALAYQGAPVVLINTTFHGYMLEYVLNDAGCRTLLCEEQYLEALLASETNLMSLESIIVSGSFSSRKDWSRRFNRIRVVGLDDLPGEIAAFEEATVSHDDLHCVVYSSGTTGPSKGIMISNAHALIKAFEVITICDFRPDDVLYSPLPLFYSMGLLRGVLSVALMGASIALRDKFSASAYWDDVCFHHATVGHCVFSIPQMLKQTTPKSDDADNPLRCMFNAQYDAAFEERFGVKLIESYGLTEGGNAIYNRLDRPTRPGSCGQVSDDWEVRLGDADGVEVPLGDMGEILLRPRHPARLMLGYLNKPEATTKAFRDLWFHTGDLARKDADGYYFYVGRNKDVVRRRGQNISAWEVEQIVLTYPEVSEVAALARPSNVGEDDLRVVIVAREEIESPDLEALARYCEAQMPAFMVPRYFELVNELPKTPSGRVEKYKLENATSDRIFDRGEVRRPSK
jgi:crotonobetaine/carnitine-CoA ligase